MKTKIIDLTNFSFLSTIQIQEKLEKVVKDIRDENVVAFPTETVYGLGANALSINAVQKIFKIKGRPSDNPLIVHIALLDEIERLIDLKNIENKNLILSRLNKATKFWPGPISFILPANLSVVPGITLGNLKTVAIRYPDHIIAQQFIKFSNCPIAAPSANLSGRPSCTKASDVFNDFNGKIKYIIDAGESVYGIESTVVDLTTEIPTILRPGMITYEDLLEEFEDIQIYSKKENLVNPRSPGMKYTHYKPEAKVVLIIDLNEYEIQSEEIREIKRIFENKIKLLNNIDEKILTSNNFILIEENIYNKGKIENKINIKQKITFNNSYDFAKKIYTIFREADKNGINYILINPYLKNSGINLAIMNRLIKAAEEIWII